MSNQCGLTIRDINPCNDMDAWWTMITSVYNFLSASTNLAQTLDRKYANLPTNMRASPLLIKSPRKESEIAFLEDFPWFLQLLNDEPELTDQVRYYCNMSLERISEVVNHIEEKIIAEPTLEREQKVPPVQNICETIDIEKELRDMHTMEQMIIQSYLEREEKALRMLTNCTNLRTNEKNPDDDSQDSITDDETVIPNRDDTVKELNSDDSCYFQDFSDSEQTIDSVNLQSAYESLEDMDRNPPPQMCTSPNKNHDAQLNSFNLQSAYESLEDMDRNPPPQMCTIPNKNHDAQPVNLREVVSEKSTREQNGHCAQKEICKRKEIIQNSSLDLQNPTVDLNSCPNCHKPSKCKHDVPTRKPQTENICIVGRLSSDSSSKSCKTDGNSVKIPVFSDDRNSQYSLQTTKRISKKNYSDIVPKNIDEIKKHLKSISKSRLCKNSTRKVEKRSCEEKNPCDSAGKSKNMNYTVFTAKVSYKGPQKDDHVERKSYRLSNRFASVESVVKKLIMGGSKITEHKDGEISENSGLKASGALKTAIKTDIAKVPGESENHNNAVVKSNKNAKKPIQKLPKQKSDHQSEPNSEKSQKKLSVAEEKVVRNKYTISSPLGTRNSSRPNSANARKSSVTRSKVDSNIVQQNSSQMKPSSPNPKAKAEESSKQRPTSSKPATEKQTPKEKQPPREKSTIREKPNPSKKSPTTKNRKQPLP